MSNALKEQASLDRITASPEVWRARVWHALRHLDDRSILNQSSLSRLNYIKRLAEREFKDNGLGRGLALKHTLLTCVDKITLELDGELGLTKTCQFLKFIRQGYSITSISKSLGLSREHVTRHYKKKAVELVTQEFLRIAGHSNLSSKHPPRHATCNFCGGAG
jgi:hypothetical protein